MSASEYFSEQLTMLALVILGLVVCESATSIKFKKVSENTDGVIYYPNNYDFKLGIRNEQEQTTDMKKDSLNRKLQNLKEKSEKLDHEIEEIDRRKEFLDRKIENLIIQKENIDRQIEKFNRQKENLDRDIEIIYQKKKNFERNIDYFNRQRERLDNKTEEVDLKVEIDTDIDRDMYKVHRAAVEDNEYRITINLPGYDEKEITVKSGKRRLFVQAVHDVNGEPKRTVQNIRNLPDFVTENGSWSYKWGVLRIIFPVTDTRYKTNIVVDTKGIINNDNLKKNYTNTRTLKDKVQMKINNVEVTTAYVLKEDEHVKSVIQGNNVDAFTDGNIKAGEVRVTAQMPNKGDYVDVNTNDKNDEQKTDATTSFLRQGYEIEATTYLPNQSDGEETTDSVPKQDDEMQVTTFVPNRDDGAGTSTKVPHQQLNATTYSVTDNEETRFLAPVIY